MSVFSDEFSATMSSEFSRILRLSGDVEMIQSEIAKFKKKCIFAMKTVEELSEDSDTEYFMYSDWFSTIEDYGIALSKAYENG
jgi:hypothetical protein